MEQEKVQVDSPELQASKKWFKEAQFGMMAHWGLYTLLGGEWKGKPQVKEILTQYGDLCLVWFDVPVTISREQATELHDMVRKYQPGCLISGRIGHDLGDYHTPLDNEVAKDTDPNALYETVGTMNDSWGYRPTDTSYKSVEQILEIKNKCASIGSNYMLNVGPDPMGRFPAIACDILDGLAKANQ